MPAKVVPACPNRGAGVQAPGLSGSLLEACGTDEKGRGHLRNPGLLIPFSSPATRSYFVHFPRNAFVLFVLLLQ